MTQRRALQYSRSLSARRWLCCGLAARLVRVRLLLARDGPERRQFLVLIAPWLIVRAELSAHGQAEEVALFQRAAGGPVGSRLDGVELVEGQVVATAATSTFGVSGCRR